MRKTFSFFFSGVLLWEGYGGLYKAPTLEERRKRAAKRREKSNQVNSS